MNEIKCESKPIGRFLLADLTKVVSDYAVVIDDDYGTDTFFTVCTGETWIYGHQEGFSGCLCCELKDSALLVELLLKLGYTEFETGIQEKDPAFSWVDMLYASFEL